MNFTKEDKLHVVCLFIRTLHETAGCSAKEMKNLFHPKIIDAVVEMIGDKDKDRS